MIWDKKCRCLTHVYMACKWHSFRPSFFIRWLEAVFTVLSVDKTCFLSLVSFREILPSLLFWDKNGLFFRSNLLANEQLSWMLVFLLSLYCLRNRSCRWRARKVGQFGQNKWGMDKREVVLREKWDQSWLTSEPTTTEKWSEGGREEEEKKILCSSLFFFSRFLDVIEQLLLLWFLSVSQSKFVLNNSMEYRHLFPLSWALEPATVMWRYHLFFLPPKERDCASV